MIPALPEKKYFKIGEVADLVGVEPHVLRYWETQFPQLRPHKARSGHRLYRRREVETQLVIRELLHVQRFTIAGARQALRTPGGASSLLPRFFDNLKLPAESTLDGVTLVPGLGDDAADPTDPDGASFQSRDGASFHGGDGDAGDGEDGEMVSVEAIGLDDDELTDALEHESAARHARGGVIAVDVTASPHLVSAAPAPARTFAAPAQRIAARPAAMSSLAPQAAPPVRRSAPSAPAASASAPPTTTPPAGLISAALSARKKAQLAGALADARAVLAILDREDARSRRLHL